MNSLKRQAVKQDAVASADYERQLEYLYARRSAIDTLIESLVEYDRHRETRPVAAELKTA
jgi:hypothetical protein